MQIHTNVCKRLGSCLLWAASLLFPFIALPFQYADRVLSSKGAGIFLHAVAKKKPQK